MTQTAISAHTPWDAGSDLLSLSGVLRDVPAMPSAACVGNHDTFDLAVAGDAKAQRQAVAICHGCTERGRCHQWAATLTASDRRALGVVGGQVYARVRSAISLAKTGTVVKPVPSPVVADSQPQKSRSAVKPDRTGSSLGQRLSRAERAQHRALVERNRAARRAARAAQSTAQKQAS